MKKKIELIIQKELNNLTGKKFSKSYICKYILPIVEYIDKTNDKKFIISGSQGAGKSTLSKLIKIVIEKTSSKKVMLLSIDDYYYSYWLLRYIILDAYLGQLKVVRGKGGGRNNISSAF